VPRAPVPAGYRPDPPAGSSRTTDDEWGHHPAGPAVARRSEVCENEAFRAVRRGRQVSGRGTQGELTPPPHVLSMAAAGDSGAAAGNLTW